jgi:hypothetical protein
MTAFPRMKLSRCIALTLILYSGFVSGCMGPMKNLNASKMGPPYEITVFEKGKPVSKRKLKALSADEQAIAQWLETNRHGWRPTFGTQTPSRVVKGDGFTLNFTDHECVITIPPDPTSKAASEGKDPIRLHKRLAPGDMELAEVLNGAP